MAERDSSEARMTRSGTRANRGALPIEYRTLALRCPVCRAEFNAEVPNGGEPEARETDLRPLYRAVDPIPWWIFSCPSCRYTTYRQGFELSHREDGADGADEAESLRVGDRPPPALPVPDSASLDDLRRWIHRGELARDIAEGREPFGAERYLLGARCHEFLREDEPLAIADYYLRASWCARSAADRAQERAYQREAARRFLALLDSGPLPEAERARTLYLAAELSRRSGAFAQAVDAFTQLDSTLDPDEAEGALLAHLARRQLALAVVKSDINAVIAEADVGLEGEDA
jgi:hypothetical protein